MINDISENIASSLIYDALKGNDPLTPAELKKVLEFVQNMEVGTRYPQQDMKLFYKFLNKFYSIKFDTVDEYKEKRFISSENQFEALRITQTNPLFVPYANDILNKKLNFSGSPKKGLLSPIFKVIAQNNGLENLSDYVFKHKGLNSFPKVINQMNYNDLEAITLYRGFKSRDEINQFIRGDFYVSNWTAGSGVYFTTNKEYAFAYSDSDELILECKLIEKDCKIIDNEILIEAMTIDTDKGNFDMFYDVGIYGAIKGFDVINRIEFGYLTKLILNRGKIIISENKNSIFKI